jgi:hypothetical protein
LIKQLVQKEETKIALDAFRLVRWVLHTHHFD